MQTTPPLPDELFDRYLSGRCTEQERHAVERLLAERPADAWLAAAIRRDGVSVSIPDPEGVSQRALARLRDAMRRTAAYAADATTGEGELARLDRRAQLGSGSGTLHAPRFFSSGRFWLTAAGTALAGVVLLTGWQLHGALRGPSHQSMAATYATGNGERATMTLHDGSVVSLGVASRLEVPADYPAGNHTLRLTGEAMFTVAHHAGRPFTVLAGGTEERVLGTSFMVRHYATDTATIVAVRDGKVAVRAGAARPTVLTAARQATVSRAGRIMLGAADPARFTFTSGVLTLNGVSLRDAVVELNRWYDADVRLGDPALGNRHVVQGEFAAGSLGDLANLLELTFDVRVVRTGRVLTLFPR